MDTHIKAAPFHRCLRIVSQVEAIFLSVVVLSLPPSALVRSRGWVGFKRGVGRPPPCGLSRRCQLRCWCVDVNEPRPATDENHPFNTCCQVSSRGCEPSGNASTLEAYGRHAVSHPITAWLASTTVLLRTACWACSHSCAASSAYWAGDTIAGTVAVSERIFSASVAQKGSLRSWLYASSLEAM